MKIAIIPGHGGSDSGAVNRYYGEKEKDFNWQEAELLAQKLESAQTEAIRCREEEESVSALTMQSRANESQADLCFCLHHNGSNGSARGWKVFYHTESSKSLAEMAKNGFHSYVSIKAHGSGITRAHAHHYPRVYHCIKQCTMPTILPESCFVDNNEDCKWLKNGGWQEFVDALLEAASGSTTANERTEVKDLHIELHDLCEVYLELHRERQVKLPGLMAVTFAQWMLESGWCQSDLAQKAFNFGGLKDRPQVRRGGRYFYGGEHYERFDSLEDFILGYWEFLDRKPYQAYNRNESTYANDPSGFMECIGPIYCPSPDYVLKVLRVYDSHRFRPFRERLESF